MRFRPTLLAPIAMSACAVLHAGEPAVATRYGPVSVVPASEARSALLFKGQPVARMRGDASLHKLAIHSDSEYVLADAESPDPDCRHEFMLMVVGAEGAPAVSAPFGKCLALFGARLQDGKAVVQLAEAARASAASAPVHEFMFADGQVSAMPKVLETCVAGALSAASTGVALTPDEAGKTVGGAGRAYFHTAPLDACRTPKVFLVPGDRVRASRETDAFVEIEYRNPKSGQVFRGWLKRDRLIDPAQ